MLIQAPRVVACEIVAAVAKRVQERPIGLRSFIREEGLAFLQFWADGEKRSRGSKRASLNSCGKHIGERLPEAYVYDTKAAEIPVLGAERAVDEVDLLDQLRCDG